jgi:hypothetical protein
MSRIYEALKNAQEQRSKNEISDREGLGVMDIPERRGGVRHDIDVDLTVYGRRVSDLPFLAHAQAMKGNSSGGLFLLAVPVLVGQDLFLINSRTSKEQLCRVVNVRARDPQTNEISVLFPSPNPEFWEIPAADGEK